MDGMRLSSFSGYVSIAAWIVVYTPQIILCYTEQTGEGLSLAFLVVWLLGDATNLIGSFAQSLLPTMTGLAAYYLACDLVLIIQVFYYRRKREQFPHLYPPTETTNHHIPALPLESDPLLTPATLIEEKRLSAQAGYTLAIIASIAVVAASWILSASSSGGRRSREEWNTPAQVVGWISAALYLGSRLPQILKNMETKCDGLSLLMFAFAVAGNVTYVASILLQGLSREHLLINSSWLVGSGGTIILDFIVLGQFAYYARARNHDKLFVDEVLDEEM